MEERKHLLDYLAQTMLIFGVTIFAVAVICRIVGDEARGFSTMFALGSEGLPLSTIFQYLLSAACITGLRLVFFSDILLKKAAIAKRTIAMLGSVTVLIGIFARLFGWFPVEDLKCWMIFFLCFGICFTASAAVCVWKEAADNRQLENALKDLKEEKWKH